MNLYISILIFLFHVLQEGLTSGLVLGIISGLVMGLVFGFAFPEERKSPFGLVLVLTSPVLGMGAYLAMAFGYGVSADVVYLGINIVFALCACLGMLTFCLLNRGGLRGLWEVGTTERVATVIKITLFT